jgi:hypothetical protein
MPACDDAERETSTRPDPIIEFGPGQLIGAVSRFVVFITSRRATFFVWKPAAGNQEAETYYGGRITSYFIRRFGTMAAPATCGG